MRKNVCIVGVGLIGGSLGMALRKNKPKKYVVTGFGRNAKKLQIAQRMGAVDRFETDAARAVQSADIVVLCVPVHRIVPQLVKISRWIKKGAIVTDVGSVKKSVVAGMRHALRRRPDINVVGAHPIAGSEKIGVENADAALFKNATCVITTDERHRTYKSHETYASYETERKRATTMDRRWRTLCRNDRRQPRPFSRAHQPPAAFAGVHVISNRFPTKPGKNPIVESLVAGSFRDMTRIAGADAELWAGILETNRAGNPKNHSRRRRAAAAFRPRTAVGTDADVAPAATRKRKMADAALTTKTLSAATQLQGRLRVPPDKSLTHRSLFFSALADGVSTITNPLAAEDCLSTAKCLEQLGCEINRTAQPWTVKGVGLFGFKKPTAPLDCGNSGTTMRLISGLLSAQNFSITLTGDASLSKRPMNRVAEPLTKMGARFELRDGKFAPFQLTGTKNIRPIEWSNPVASAQVKSAVLLAALHAHGETVYREPTVSRDHTERMLEASGAKIRREGTTTFLQGPAKIKPMEWRVPGDISSAAFFIVAALLAETSDVCLENVNINPTRTGILDVLRDAGAQIKLENQRLDGGELIADIRVQGRQQLKAFQINKTIAPRLIDEIPILAVAATQAEGLSIFSGLEELRVKETDRLKALATNLGNLGASVKETDDGLIIQGPTRLKGASVESFDDHRIAMSMAIASLVTDGEINIRQSQCVAISFPTFWDALDQLTQS